MAKQIKAIKCPQCGSVDNKQIKDDYYKCENCGAQYFLDSDDVNVNVKHSFDNSRPAPTGIKPVKALGMILVVMVAMSIFVIMITKGFKNSVSTFGNANITGFRDNSELDFPMTTNGKDAYIFSLSSRYYSSLSSTPNSRNGIYYSFLDANNGKMVKTEPITALDKLTESKARKFSDGNYYIVANKKKVMRIDAANMSLEDITVSMFEKDPAYTSGIASVEFVYDSQGEGFKVMTNTGKELFYYPLVNKSYTQQEFYNNYHGMKTLLPGAKDSTYYVFTLKSTINRDVEMRQEDQVQLLKVVYKYNAGGPQTIADRPTWYQGNIRGSKMELTQIGERERVVSYKNLTPDKLYFNPHILYYDKNHLLIKYKVTAAEDAAKNVQSIDVETGEVLWTVQISPKYDYYYFYKYTALIDKKYYVKTSAKNYFVVDEDGKNLKYFEIPSEF